MRLFACLNYECMHMLGGYVFVSDTDKYQRKQPVRGDCRRREERKQRNSGEIMCVGFC